MINLTNLSRNSNKLLLLTVIVYLISCSKKDDLQKSNEVKATAIYSSGNSINFYANGKNTMMSCGVFSEMILSANDQNGLASFHFNISGSGAGNCINRTGNYKLYGSYHSKSTGQPIIAYDADWGRKVPNITFTVVNDDQMEGHFDGVFYNGNDSVIVNGTFKGDFVY